MSTVSVVDFQSDYRRAIAQALELIPARETIARAARVLIKPNLVEVRPPPVTTPAAATEALLIYLRDCGVKELIIAEGSGGCETPEAFLRLGYEELARRYNAELLDFNSCETELLARADCPRLPEFHLPRALRPGEGSYFISFPVLKAHTMSTVTLSLKNLVGMASSRYYRAPGHYSKAKLHPELDRAILDLARHRKPDLALIDGAVGMKASHLWGPPCNPPLARIIASLDPVAADSEAARILGFPWREVEHLRLANGVLG